jgi:hypothetical protein
MKGSAQGISNRDIGLTGLVRASKGLGGYIELGTLTGTDKEFNDGS